MDRNNGRYSKSGDDLVSRITRLPKGVILGAPESSDPSNSSSYEISDGSFFYVSRSTGWTIAGLLTSLLVGTAYIGSTFFTQERQVEHYRNQLKQMSLDIDELKEKNQELERRMVGLSTQLENLKKGPDD